MNLKEIKLFIYDQVLSIVDISLRHFLFYHVSEILIFSQFLMYMKIINGNWKK